MFEDLLFGLFVAAVGGGVPDAGECALREQVEPFLAGLPVAAGLVAGQVQPHLCAVLVNSVSAGSGAGGTRTHDPGIMSPLL